LKAQSRARLRRALLALRRYRVDHHFQFDLLDEGHGVDVMEQEHAAVEHQHPEGSSLVYVVVAALLTVLTAMELGIFYVPALRVVLVPLLIVLSGAKFALVVMFYMHLRYESIAYTIIFVPLLILAVAIVCSLVALMTIFLGPV